MLLKFDKAKHQSAMKYMETWFWSFETLAKASNLSADALNQMLQHGCAPGAIYAFDNDNGWWSALAAYTQKMPACPEANAQIWYSPAAVWWLRRSILLLKSGLNYDEAARANRKSFVQDFTALLPKVFAANLAYPSCFTEGDTVDKEAAITVANSEWDAWISGAYGVCMRDFTASTCMRKEANATLIRLHTEFPNEYNLSDIELIDLTQELASLITPFSPWERPVGTPGRTIDVVLDRFQLGDDYPYPISGAATAE